MGIHAHTRYRRRSLPRWAVRAIRAGRQDRRLLRQRQRRPRDRQGSAEPGSRGIGVSRNPESLKFDNARFTAVPGDVTDPDSIVATVRGANVVVISVRGVGPGNTPQEAVTFRAATAYIEAASRLGDATPYVIQIGGGVTLYRDGVRSMDTLPPGTERYAVAQGHWLAMEAYQHSAGFDWTVMSANTGSIQERGRYTGRFGSGTRTRSSIEAARRTSLDKISRSR